MITFGRLRQQFQCDRVKITISTPKIIRSLLWQVTLGKIEQIEDALMVQLPHAINVPDRQKINIYISCVREDLMTARWLYFQLKSAGFSPWMDSEDLRFGDNVDLLIEQAIQESDAYLICISSESINKISTSKYLKHEAEQAIKISSNHSLGKYLIAFVLIDKVDVSILSSKLSKYKYFSLHKDKKAEVLSLIESLANLVLKKAKKARSKSIVISRIDLSNIRCFKSISIDFENNKNPNYWIMLLGDNAVGKSTLLKSIALGLCNESDAVALIKEMPGDFVRKGAEEGCITIHLREDKQSKSPGKYSITTRIIKNSEDDTEIVRQETMPVKNFPWADIFVCGYGSNRSTQAYNSYEQYKVIDAVKSLFDPQAFLQNPEVVLLRQDPSVRSIIEEKLQSILLLDTPEYKINYTKRGLELDGPWGRMPFQVLSDGYRSTTQWVLDFVSWLILAERLIGNPDIGGILIIDEIEQHLHPRWQRYIVQRLRQQFPKTQIIASTHTPLVAAGIADVDRGMLLKLDRNEDSEITVQIIDKEQIAGKRADQVLTSEAFGLVTTRNARSHDDIDRYTELLGKQTRTEAETAELEELRSIVQSRLSNGETAAAQIVEKAVDEALQGIITNVSPEMLDVETKKQLRALFQSES